MYMLGAKPLILWKENIHYIAATFWVAVHTHYEIGIVIWHYHCKYMVFSFILNYISLNFQKLLVKAMTN
jgi:hypothetical protein